MRTPHRFGDVPKTAPISRCGGLPRTAVLCEHTRIGIIWIEQTQMILDRIRTDRFVVELPDGRGTLMYVVTMENQLRGHRLDDLIVLGNVSQWLERLATDQWLRHPEHQLFDTPTFLKMRKARMAGHYPLDKEHL